MMNKALQRLFIICLALIFLTISGSLSVSADPLSQKSQEEIQQQILPPALVNFKQQVPGFCSGDDAQVTLYNNDNAGGEYKFSKTKCDDLWYESDLTERSMGYLDNFNDKISSITFNRGYDVPFTFWLNVGYSGACITLQGRQDGARRMVNLNDFGWNNAASSLAFGGQYGCSQVIVLDPPR